MFDLTVDHTDQFGHHVETGNQQMPESRLRHFPFQHGKHFIYIRYDLVITGKQGHIRVDPGSLFIKIAGTEISEIAPFISIIRIFPDVRSIRKWMR